MKSRELNKGSLTIFASKISGLTQWRLAPLFFNYLGQWGKPPLDKLAKIVNEPK